MREPGGLIPLPTTALTDRISKVSVVINIICEFNYTNVNIAVVVTTSEIQRRCFRWAPSLLKANKLASS